MSDPIGQLRRAVLLGGVLGLAALLLGAFGWPDGSHFRQVPTAPSTGSPPQDTGEAGAGPATPGPSWPSLRVVALGDSVTAGANCSCDPFPELYADALHAGYATPVGVANDGVSGETSADVLADLRADRAEESEVAAANVVVITIGANDFAGSYDDVTRGTCGGSDPLSCVRAAMSRLGPQLDAIVARVHQLRSGAPTAILMTGYWNVFQDGDVASATFPPAGLASTDRLTRAANSVIEHSAAGAGATYVDLYRPFKGAAAEQNPSRLLADDGDHPNAAGHRVIAAALLQAGLAPLSGRRRAGEAGASPEAWPSNAVGAAAGGPGGRPPGEIRRRAGEAGASPEAWSSNAVGAAAGGSGGRPPEQTR